MLTAHYSQNPQVRVMIMGGSVARGYADAYSDLELGVFWNTPPSDTERKNLIAEVGGDLWTFNAHLPDTKWLASEHWGLPTIKLNGQSFAGTAMIDVKHMTVANLQQCLTDVTRGLDTSLDKQVVLSAITDAVPLYGDTMLGEWQKEALSFPKQLAVKIVQENLWFGPWFPAQAYVQRDDVLVMQQHFLWAEQAILRVLCAVNRLYFPSREYKWMDRLIERFQIAPNDLSNRMKLVFKLSLDDGWQSLRELIAETIAIVEHHLPEVNTMALFADHPEINTAWAQRRWEPEPPYTLLQTVGTQER